MNAGERHDAAVQQAEERATRTGKQYAVVLDRNRNRKVVPAERVGMKLMVHLTAAPGVKR